MSTQEATPIETVVVQVQRGDETQEYPVGDAGATLGRARDNSIVLNDAFASRHHAKIDCSGAKLTITDLGSGNGTLVNGERLQPNSPRVLRDGDRVQIGDYTVVPRLPDSDKTMFESSAAVMDSLQTQASAPAQKLNLAGRDRLSIGRAPDSDVPLAYPSVSRRHAEITRQDKKYVIQDLASANGTFVNGERVQPNVPRELRPGDMIRIGPVRFIVAAQSLEQVDESGNIRLDALHLTQITSKGRALFHDISLSILPREFVAIVGVSGAGKSTLLNALSGYKPAREGAVLINGVDLYHHFDAYRNEIGFVPQQDIIHKELTVLEALDYSARLRLPSDTTAEERKKRVEEVLKTLDLTERKNVPISSLSGGQLKRISIGVELLTSPGLFFLDEATSGLDPGTESQLMHLLRKLADQGHTILLITHATKNVMLCDQVLLLAKGGNVAYFGPPAESLTYFGVQDFDEIYNKLENERSPQEWAEMYRKSPQGQKYVIGRLQEKYGPLPSIPSAPAAKKGVNARTPGHRVSSLRQFLILSQRNINIIVRDRLSLLLMLLVAPLIGLMIFATFKQGVFSPNGGDIRQSLTSLFLIAMDGVFIGAIGSMREIVKELDIYKRERLVFLRIIPYVLSKVWLGVLLSLYQALVFIVITRLASGWPDTIETGLQVFFTIWLVLLASMFLGLFVSAISPNQNVTPLLLILVVLPQLVFGGALLRIKSFGVAGEIVSPLTITKWSHEALVTISGVGKAVATDACWNLPKDQRDALSEDQKIQQGCTCMGPSLFKTCNFPGIMGFYNPAIDQPQPPEPAKPGDPPPAPTKPVQPADQSPAAQQKFQADTQTFLAALDQYQKDLTTYQDKVKQYESDVEAWRTVFQKWKEDRGKAIGQAEATIERFNDDQGQTFNVDLPTNWGVLGLNMAVMFGLTLLIQKRKDNL